MKKDEVEIAGWETPFMHGELWVVSLDWGYQKFAVGLIQGL